jgi:hypothetical protein
MIVGGKEEYVITRAINRAQVHKCIRAQAREEARKKLEVRGQEEQYRIWKGEFRITGIGKIEISKML